MKKKFYVGMALLTGAAVLSAYVANQKAQRSDLLRANIEALAADENGGEGGEVIVKLPCIGQAMEVCKFPAIDAAGNMYEGRVYDARNI